jgi:ATP-dependent protease ClpP protease subunit
VTNSDQTKTVYIIFLAAITETTVNNFIKLFFDLFCANYNEFYLMFSTTGGDIDPAFLLYNYLKLYNVDIITYNVNHIDSCGIIPFMAGKRRLCSPTARFGFHNLSHEISINDQKDFTLFHNNYEFYKQRFFKFFETNLKKLNFNNLTSSQILKHLDPEDALAAGILTEGPLELNFKPRTKICQLI